MDEIKRAQALAKYLAENPTLASEANEILLSYNEQLLRERCEWAQVGFVAEGILMPFWFYREVGEQ